MEALIVAGVILVVIIVAAIVIARWLVSVYNSLVELRNEATTALAQIDTEYQMRLDLIPALVKTVKGYATHEKSTLEAVIKARASATQAVTQDSSFEANEQLGSAIGRLLVSLEAYPELQANRNFMDLQSQIEDLERRINLSRRYFNESVRVYNTAQQKFPANMVAKPFGHTGLSQWKARAEAENPPEFDF